MNEKKKVVYIAGPITGVTKYYEAFEQAEDDLTAIGYIPLSPARLPQGMTNKQYAHICIAMLDSADAVLFLDGWEASKGALVEKLYADYIKKPCVSQRTRSPLGYQIMNADERRAWLRVGLMEAFDWAVDQKEVRSDE